MTTLARAALAPATSRAYDNTWRRLRAFLHRPLTAPLFPVTTAEVVDFIGDCFASGGGASALASHCSAIAYGHRIRGLRDPTADFRVRKLLTGARRLRPSWDSRTAITLADLGRLQDALGELGLPAVDAAAFRAIFSLAFFAMLRPGEVLVGGDPNHTIRLGHVVVQRDRLSLTLPSSKTSSIPFNTVLVARPDLSTCPVRAMRQYLQLRPPGRPADYLFVASLSRPLTTRSLNHTLKLAGSVARLDASRLTGHCFRIGGATHGAQCGMSELQLSEAGRWSSSAVRRYLRRPVSLLQFRSEARQ